MTALRVLHLVASFDTGGLQKGVATLVNHGDASRFEHLVLSMSPSIEMAERLVHGDVKTLGVGFGQAANLGARVAEVARAFGADVLHTRNWPTLVDGWRARRALGRIPHVHGHHGRDADTARRFGFKRELLGRIITRGLDRVVTLTSAMADEYRSSFGRARGGLSLIPNGVVIPEVAARPRRPGDPFHVLAVGRLDPVKDYGTLVRAFAAMPGREPEDRLTIAGGGPEMDALRQVAADAGVAEQVLLPGPVHPVQPLYLEAHAFVQSSIYEGMSNTVAEAMAAGLPVIATRRGGNPDVVGDAGHLIEAEDVLALSGRLGEVRGDPGAATALGSAARDRAEQRFSVAAMVSGYEAVWTEIHERRR